mmetsp:Transcript_38691/g.45049  ORF Transcript_38691/g.45049 Transcript_38691/m.45049 type:complete len:145 (-) Transcript_38691:292-726(-)
MEAVFDFDQMLNNSFLAYQKKHTTVAQTESNSSLQSFFEELGVTTNLKNFESQPKIAFEEKRAEIDLGIKELEDQLASMKKLMNSVPSSCYAKRAPLVEIKPIKVPTKTKVAGLMNKKIENLRSKYCIQQEVTKIHRASRKICK